MWPYSWTHVGTPSHLGHMDRLAATMPSQAHAGAAQEAPNIGRPLDKTFFLHRQRRHPQLPKIPTYLPRGLRGVRAAPQPRGLQDHYGARGAAQSIALSDHGSAATLKEVDRPGLPHQRVPSADRYRPHSQPRHPPPQPHRSNRFNNHHQGPQDQVRPPLPW